MDPESRADARRWAQDDAMIFRIPPSCLILALRRFATSVGTNFDVSPPRTEISRTMVADMNMYCSPGVRKMVSTSGYMPRFMPGQLELVFEIGHRAQAAHHDARAALLHELHQQARKPHDFDVLQVFQHLARHFDALVQREERLLRLAVGNREHDAIEQPRRAPREVFMAQRDRIECPRVNRRVVHPAPV